MGEHKNNQSIYLIKPRLGGLANDLQVLTEDKRILFHIKARLFCPAGRTYEILDGGGQAYMQTKQDHTACFPRHTVYQGERTIAKLGQGAIIPLKYFIKYEHRVRMEIGFGVFESTFVLCEVPTQRVVAETVQYRDTWIVALSNEEEPAYFLTLLAVIYRETSIGG